MGASSADTAYEKILDMISTREIKSGDKINESTIANRFGMSRTPVREAIRRLQQDGLVEVRKNQGSFLRKYSYAEMADGYEITAMLTQMACRHLAEKYDQIDESDKQDIEHVFDEMDDCAKNEKKREWVILDRYFHDKLIELTGIWQLQHTYQNLMVWVHQVLWLITPVFVDLQASTDDHRALWRLIQERKAEEAGEFAYRHQLKTIQMIRRLGEFSEGVM